MHKRKGCHDASLLCSLPDDGRYSLVLGFAFQNKEIVVSRCKHALL
jgi:hypothetical protein